MRNWEDVLPADVAKQQHIWDRCVSAGRMRRVGMTSAQIGHRLGVSPQRAWQIATRGDRYLRFAKFKRSPIERYFAGDDIWNEPRPNSLKSGLKQVVWHLEQMQCPRS